MTYPCRVNRVVDPAEELSGMGDGRLYRLLDACVDRDLLGLEVRVRDGCLGLGGCLSRGLDVYVCHDDTASTLFGKG